MRIHLDTVILTAFLIRGFECAVISRAMKCNKLIEAVSHPFEGAVSAVYDSI